MMRTLFTTLLLATALTTQADNNITSNQYKLLLDTTVVITHAKDVWDGQQKGQPALPQAFTGKGVVAGVIDMGLDVTHPMFRDAQGNSRVKWYWDTYQNVVCDTPEKALAAGPALTSAITPHGTHVAGIMAGSEFAGIKGMAYDADMMFTDFYPLLSTEQKQVLIDELKKCFPDKTFLAQRAENLEDSDIVLLAALKKIFDNADQLGQPCVINMSYGSRDLWKYTANTAREVIDEMLATPGHILVVGMGNDGLKNAYYEKKAGESVTVNIPSNYGKTLVTWKRTDKAPVLNFTRSQETLEVTFDKLLEAIPDWDPASDGTKVLEVKVEDSYNSVTLTYMDQLSTTEDIVVMISGGFYGQELFTMTCDSEDAMKVLILDINANEDEAGSMGRHLGTLSTLAGFDNVISVGAMHHRSFVKDINGNPFSAEKLAGTPGQLLPLSSCGPSLHGVIKPDVVAPGHNIISAFSGNTQHESMLINKVYEEEKFGAKHALGAFTGTSMATPCVSGIIALWLEANPKLTMQEVKEILRKTSHQPEDAYTEKNNYYGWGEIDAYAGLLEVLGLTSSIQDLSTQQPAQAHFRMVGKTLHITMDDDASAQLKVYTTAGVLADEYSFEGNATINLSHLPAGVYALQLNTGRKATTGSTLVRL